MTTAINEGDVVELLRSDPQWAKSSIEVSVLHGGITNRNYVALIDGKQFVVRIPGERTEMLCINRVNEVEATQRAANLGIAPPIVGQLHGVGTMITEFVTGTHLADAEFVERLPDVVGLIRRFHESGGLAGEFPIHRVVELHARDALDNGVKPPAQWPGLHQVSKRIEECFARSAEPRVPCHNDLLPTNVLFDVNRTWLLDFEYAGMNNRYFDLGNLSVNTQLDDASDEKLLECYFGRVTKKDMARLRLMKIMSELREGMWAVVQQAISTLETDFVAYAETRLTNCVRLASASGLDELLTDAT